MDIPASLTMISSTTIARIFRELSFKQNTTRITLSTLELSSQYIQLFINEAIIRSNEERILEGDEMSKVDGIDNLPQAEPQAPKPSQIKSSQIPGPSQAEALDFDSDFDDYEDPTQEPNTQLGILDTFANDTLDTRHLSKVAGILVLDF